MPPEDEGQMEFLPWITAQRPVNPKCQGSPVKLALIFGRRQELAICDTAHVHLGTGIEVFIKKAPSQKDGREAF
jgi:hypothetical protein